MKELDIKANRVALKWSRRSQLGRLLWAFVQPLFTLSPRPCWAWRRFLLRLFGAKIGSEVHIYPSVRITIPWNLDIGEDSAIGDRVILYALGPIRIGARATISQNVHVCAGSHDYHRHDMRLLKPPISIGDGSWVCADAFVGPGVTIGTDAVIGARSVVVRDVAANMVVAGNPAREIRSRS